MESRYVLNFKCDCKGALRITPDGNDASMVDIAHAPCQKYPDCGADELIERVAHLLDVGEARSGFELVKGGK